MAHAALTLRTWIVATFADRDRDRGASLVEYALLLVLIAMVCIIAVEALGSTTSTSFSNTASGFSVN